MPTRLSPEGLGPFLLITRGGKLGHSSFEIRTRACGAAVTSQLLALGALDIVDDDKLLPGRGFYSKYRIKARLTWPMEITETKFYEKINRMPQAKTRLLLASW